MPLLTILKNVGRVFTDHGGKPSFSRVGSAALLGAYVYVMIVTRKVPDNSDAFAAVLLALYGANSIRNAVTAFGPSSAGASKGGTGE